MKQVLDKKQLQVVGEIIKQIRDEKTITKFLTPIQTSFFDNYKNIKASTPSESAFKSKVACIEKLGSMIQPKLRSEFFDHFDKALDTKLTRPSPKHRKNG